MCFFIERGIAINVKIEKFINIWRKERPSQKTEERSMQKRER